VARWTKKNLIFAITSAEEQVTFIERLKRKLKVDFQVKADQRGITVILRGDADQVRHAVKRTQGIYQEVKQEEM
jgi:hypothetical protein